MQDRYAGAKGQHQVSRTFNDGIAFHRDGIELYDDGKHLGCVLPRSRKIALYKERRPYMSTSYRRKLTEFVHKEFGYIATDTIWF